MCGGVVTEALNLFHRLRKLTDHSMIAGGVAAAR
jgi:hypothetical protein